MIIIVAKNRMFPKEVMDGEKKSLLDVSLRCSQIFALMLTIINYLLGVRLEELGAACIYFNHKE